LGVPSNNISLNDKKPYTLLKTMKTTVPTRVDFEEAVTYKDFFLWLKSQSSSNMTINYEYVFDRAPEKSEDDSRFDVYINKKEGVIEDFDNIPFRPEKMEFKYYNYLNITENDNVTAKADEVWGRGRLLENISYYFFAGKMKGYFKNAEPKVETNVFTNKMQSLFFISRSAIYDFIVYDVKEPFKAMADKVAMESIKEQLLYTTKGIPKKIGEAYNLRLSLLRDFSGGDNNMGDVIKNLNELLKDKLNQKELTICSSDEEFYFTVGQLTYYILYQSEAKDKSYGMIEPFIHAKTSQDLKNKLKDIFTLYKHAINLDYLRFKNAFSMVMGYDCNAKFTGRMQDMYYAGLMSNNILFSKSEKNNEEEDK
jgi:CRISPR-associated protein Csh1